MNLKVVSGGQTGADLAGLWAAYLYGVPTGGVAPENFKTLIGERPSLGTTFNLVARGDYRARTIENVKSSDLTVVFASNIFSPGTKLTLNTCAKNSVPHLLLSFSAADLLDSVQASSVRLISELRQRVLTDSEFVVNVAGNSSRNSIKVFTFTFFVMCKVLNELVGSSDVVDQVGLEKLEAAVRDRFEIDDGMFKLLT